MLNAREYLDKINQICKDNEPKGCSECALSKFGCGIPKEDDDFDKVIAFVERYEENRYPFGYCLKCKYEFNSELINEYEIKYCLKCGEKLDAKEAGADA
ncbi:hypothetical protein [Sporomusa malonica]|uniref:Uncharacterized protein n=1 Tax=Sporomusa malonica TaxID=112901 RepID=A0A1W2ASU4_9FIRM|nr:hypothetical protein [Sporomusa malonica]SMC63773.1 hypothetical protein SAMN04488500_10689 [Sporomusa malonica]